MKPRASAPVTRVRPSTTRRRRSRQRPETFAVERHSRLDRSSRLLVAVLGLAVAVAAAAWLVVTTPVWVVLGVALLAALPFVLTYAAVELAGLLVALDEHERR